jgi:uncharacterized membrane protein YjjP (DUF1212 family)
VTVARATEKIVGNDSRRRQPARRARRRDGGSQSTALELTATAAELLFRNGQTTVRTQMGARRLARALGFTADVRLRWGEIAVGIDDKDRFLHVEPVGVDMAKVAATEQVIDGVERGELDATATAVALRAVGAMSAVSDTRFAIFAAAGAVALSVIFGVIHLFPVVVIALSAGAGGYLRRWLGRKSHNPLLQPFCAALLAGAIGSIALHLRPEEAQRLVAVCPCMVLVPGPHILNGALDLARVNIPLGAARLGFALLVILMICAGLLLGLSFGGITLPVTGTSVPVPLIFDVLAAGVAVAAYGTFFSMPARMLPVPIVVGMLAHGARWIAIAYAGVSVEGAALLACLVVGLLITPSADWLRMPFAAVAFAAVVSLMPGVYIFRMAEGLMLLIRQGTATSSAVVTATAADGTTAFLITLAMGFGLLLPKICLERLWPSLAGRDRA